MTSYSSRPFNAPDLGLLIDFAARCTAGRLPGLTYWNPGDIAWQLGVYRPDTDFSPFVRLWEAHGQVVALAIFEPPLNFEFDIDPALGYEPALIAEIFGWVEVRRRAMRGAEGEIPSAYSMLGDETLSVTSLESDQARVALLRDRGYERVERHSVRYARRLDEAIAIPVLPARVQVRNVTEADIEARVDVHKDAWSVWGNSSFSVGRYLRLRETPIYDETLDIVAEGADGRLLSYCTTWFDAANRIGHFEPVGTRPAFAGQGLGRAVVLEGLRRLRERGAHTALIGTASVNAPALRT